MSEEYLAATRERRTVYGLTAKSTVSDDKLFEIVKHAVLHTPTSFNNQSVRAVLLLNDHHKKLWDIVLDALRAHVAADKFAPTEARIKGFQAGYGTVLYFTDEAKIKASQEAFPSYSDQFPIWAANSQGILQATIWTAFAKEGLGASLQHYNQLIETQVVKEFKLPETWKFSAQAPFGVPSPDWQNPDKAFDPIDDRARLFA